MTLQLVTVLEKNPASCYLCNGTPVDLEGNVLPMVDTEAEANWGDNVYICKECSGIIASLFGWVSDQEQIERLEAAEADVKNYKKRYKNIEKELDKERGRNRVIDKAKKAMREKAAK